MEFDYFDEKGYYWFKREGEKPVTPRKRLCSILKEFSIEDFNELCGKMSSKGLAVIRLCHLPKLVLYLINTYYFHRRLIESETLLPPQLRVLRVPSFLLTTEGDEAW
ncbi:MAG: hypothetical protein QXM43_04665 [Desulfurococcaceae archaeon]